jgi:pyruvate dehydrogenase E2 component (dihydrolipoamide acetyltransferase)
MDGRLITPSRMREGIGRRMSDSKRDAPHFYVQAEIEVDPLRTMIDAVNAGDPPVRITMTAALARACAQTLRVHRRFNSVWTADGLLQAEHVNLGIAIALDDGLLAPAVLDADRMELTELAAAIADLAARTRAQKLRPDEIAGATFTLTNLGMFDVSAFTAIITPPQVATLATGRPMQRVSLRDGVVVPSSLMTVTLSSDHRALDGADAARWLETFKQFAQDPQLSASGDSRRKEAA